MTKTVTRYMQPVVQNVGWPDRFELKTVSLVESQNGEWVRYDDIKHLLESSAEPGDEHASLRRECVDLAAEQCVSVAGCVGWPSSALLAFKLLCHRNALNRPAEPKCEPFVVKHYASDERPTIKGNGFDGLEVGADREDAEDFVKWLNERLGVNREAGQ